MLVLALVVNKSTRQIAIWLHGTFDNYLLGKAKVSRAIQTILCLEPKSKNKKIRKRKQNY